MAMDLGVSRFWLHQVLDDPTKSRRLTARIKALNSSQAKASQIRFQIHDQLQVLGALHPKETAAK